jgi:hypothetical protein
VNEEEGGGSKGLGPLVVEMPNKPSLEYIVESVFIQISSDAKFKIVCTTYTLEFRVMTDNPLYSNSSSHFVLFGETLVPFGSLVGNVMSNQ